MLCIPRDKNESPPEILAPDCRIYSLHRIQGRGDAIERRDPREVESSAVADGGISGDLQRLYYLVTKGKKTKRDQPRPQRKRLSEKRNNRMSISNLLC
ncbi:hypothetical protein PROFUN_10761 [Planoprotostelium fungivorum]|uniref:Uncharacterized protein n=1 Tax=Planoprotostelium fungivorum TaxID=1890364 RepID=A0A2P6N7Z9_9EUKA|nr:hypothetical protein PROFUN_10761 [Planoprotostelium fungivorum]